MRYDLLTAYPIGLGRPDSETQLISLSHNPMAEQSAPPPFFRQRFYKRPCMMGLAAGNVRKGLGMMATMYRTLKRAAGKVLYLPLEKIRANPSQPRRYFDQKSLETLSKSIARYGILQPLSVRKRQEYYELISGERRLRAAAMAGLRDVPCLLVSVNMEESNILAIVENLQRENLSILEEAKGISRLIEIFGLSREEAADRLGMSASAVANKIRLLRLPDDVLDKLCSAGLTERHGRALLRLGSFQMQRCALDRMIEENMNVAAAESYVESLLRSEEESDASETDKEKQMSSAAQRTFVLKDLRLFQNTLSRSMELLQRSGVSAELTREDCDDAVTYTIRIYKK